MATDLWPEWLTPQHSAIHTAIENEIKKALDHCYQSSEADGRNWTTEGWISCSASNVISMLRRLGCPPPNVGDVEALPMPMPEGPDFDEEEYFAENGSGWSQRCARLWPQQRSVPHTTRPLSTC